MNNSSNKLGSATSERVQVAEPNFSVIFFDFSSKWRKINNE